MDSESFQHGYNAFLLPSTFSPWVSNESADLADANNRSRAGMVHREEPAISPVSAHSIADSDTSSFYGERPASPVSILSQPLGVTPPSPRQDPSTPPAYATPQIGRLSSRSIRSISSFETVDPRLSSQTERRSSDTSTLGPSYSAPSSEGTIPPASNIDAKRNTVIMPTPPEAQFIPLSAMYNPNPSPRSMVSEDDGEVNNVFPRCSQVHLGCHSRRDVYIKRWSWLYVTLIILSIYSTGLSGLWLVVSIYQPQYGRGISTGNGWQLSPSTATLLATLAARTIELSFVTVFVAVLGQVLTRRAFSRFSRGVTLAEMTMRNWVIQPGSLLTHWEGLPHAATTLLGALTLIATICSLFYTTASDAMVSPKLIHQDWAMRDLRGLVKASYANPQYVEGNCQTPLTSIDTNHSAESCVNVLFSGQSYHSLGAFLNEWDGIHRNISSVETPLSKRPNATHNLFDNTTMVSSWIDTDSSNMMANFATYERIVNNVTLAMPHPGVYAAATDPINGILQPSELLGIGEYSVRASVVSPAVNVMCANMDPTELEPLVYTTWPNAKNHNLGFGNNQTVGESTWLNEVPLASETEWLNRTVVDDLFKWGEKYGRRPPVFQLYPGDYNMVTYATKEYVDALYILAKAPNITDYTLCQLQSWVTGNCSTSFDLSGTSGGHMEANCEDTNDINTYMKAEPELALDALVPSKDWRNMAAQWGLAIDLNGGTENSNASNARILTNLILDVPKLDPRLPSMAEALAVLVANTVVTGALDSTFKPVWTYDANDSLATGVYETFRAQVRTQQYASAHTAAWQVIFYPILGLTFVLNVLCLLYLVSGTALTSFSVGKSSPSSLPLTQSTPKLKHHFSSTTARFSLASKTHTLVQDTSPESDSENDDPKINNSNNQGNRTRKAAKGLVTDYTEPQNLFALAVNSPSSRALAGSCGHGPDGAALAVPWRVGYAAGANHYFFQEARGNGNGNANNRQAVGSGADLLGEDDDGRYAQSYKRLSSRRAWL
ncbi:hypothetical protein F5Y10DRAFT_285768 [Nemania abortiva]|nr:hypothetical protein F5Y10DRAFT_285768 [Nemania abortiva]